MKNLLLILMMFIGTLGYSQEIKSHYITETDSISFILKAGSCGSPDGPTTETLIIPPNYQYLEDNGYCLYSYPTTSTFTACFTFVAGSSSVDVNSGYSQSCNNVSFSNFRLFNSACVQIATGLSFSGLTPGQTYTWCLNMRAWGGPGCNGFTTFCPYFLNNIVLPIELLSFTGKEMKEYNHIEWVTASETNNDYFTLERSDDGENWERIYYKPGAGNSNQNINYSYKDYEFKNDLNYYKLTQVDFDGIGRESFIISIDNKKELKKEIKRVNIVGQEINENYKGVVLIIYEDGSYIKINQ
jgi:hypothetical protein